MQSSNQKTMKRTQRESLKQDRDGTASKRIKVILQSQSNCNCSQRSEPEKLMVGSATTMEGSNSPDQHSSLTQLFACSDKSQGGGITSFLNVS